MTKWGARVYVGLITLFLMLPLIVVAGISFNQRKSLFFPPKGFSFKWYGELFTENDWLDPLTNSIIIASSSGVIAISIALPISYFLWRYKIFFAKALFTLGIIPFMLPPVVTALGIPDLLGLDGLFRAHRKRHHLPWRLPRDPAPDDDFARPRVARQMARRGGKHHGARTTARSF